MARDKYEISLWEDYIVPATEEVPEHYEERKVAIIGSDSITAYCRAIEPNLIENINGTNTFTFKMVYKCHNGSLDDLKYQFQVLPASQGGGNEKLLDSQELQLIWEQTFFEDGEYDNPFIDLLVNERKIKVLWKEKWYDFVIKNYQKDSSGRTITFTCKDLFINELSKTGYDLEFDTKLENNQGTVLELGAKVLEDTDWQLDTENSDVIQQEKEEPVYECKTITSFTATNETGGSNITIPNNATILVFYSGVQEIVDKIEDEGETSGNTYLQFLYAGTYEKDVNSQLVINGDCCSIASAKWEKVNLEYGGQAIKISIGNTGVFYVYYQAGVSSNYRANRLVRAIQSVLDPLTEKYVNIYKATETVEGVCDTDDIIYGYRDTYFSDPTAVSNLVVNGSDFKMTEGWVSDTDNLYLTLYPKYTSTTDIESYSARSYFKLNGDKVYCNTGITDLSYLIPSGFQYGEVYILRAKVKQNGDNNPTDTYHTISSIDLAPSISGYSYENGQLVVSEDSYFQVESGYPVMNEDWIEYKVTCKESVTRAHLYLEKVAVCLRPSETCWLEELDFFAYTEGLDADGNIVRINPKELNVQSVATIRYNYYNHTKNEELTSVDDLNYIWRNYEDMANPPFTPVYNEDFVKIRSITISKSNRFNILQTLAETFECWLEPYIEHTAAGAFVYDDGVPRKYIRFKQTRGVETGVSFSYGIDLKTISKVVQSDQIVTKTIVANNSNQYAENGFCSIARSDENYPRVNFIINFDYYVNQGLIDAGALYRDLYLSSENSIGYYYWLHKWNIDYDSSTEVLTAKKTERDKQESYRVLYSGLLESANQQIKTAKGNLASLAGVQEYADATEYIQQNADSIEIQSRMAALTSLQNLAVEYEQTLTSVEEAIATLDALIETEEEAQKDIISNIKELEYKFYKKYSRFIQEGTWIDENYVDDNLYYLDAQSVAYTSAFPQVSYNISVLRLSSLEDFKNKIFGIGDIAYIEDTDFFGYVYIDNVKTPYKEKVLIAEISSFFDEPDKDSFKIQNYKTQFEDLFQRINSTTQALKYNEGSYAKAASIVNTDGTINVQTLQQSLNSATALMYSSTNNSITQDSTGITVVDVANPNNMTKVTAGGIFISSDGGATWHNTINSEGLATEYLTSGNLNTNSINILDGSFPTFRWDSKGISAFEYNDLGTNFNKFVRFDHYGIYGIKDIANFVPEDEDDIWDNASYGLTWKGFFLKSSYSNGYVSISSDEDFQVVQTIDGTDVERIKIGAIDFLGEEPIKYGIRIRNTDGEAVFETGSDGNLSITGEITATSGSIGGMKVDGDKLTMDTIVMEPGVGIYSTVTVLAPDGYENGEMIEAPAFLISDDEGTATFNSIIARGKIDAYRGTLGYLDVTGILTVGEESEGAKSENTIIVNGEEGIIKSGNYETGQSGWQIEATGNAEFNDVTARGTIYATSGDLGNLSVSGVVAVGSSGGTIEIDGENKWIQSSNYSDSSDSGWRISYDGSATFYNVNAAGGSLGNLDVAGTLTVGDSQSSAILIDGNDKVIKSSNYASASAGWEIDSTGHAEFNDVTVRGTVYASDGSFTGAIYANSGYLSQLSVIDTLTVGDATHSGLIHSYSTDSSGNAMWEIDSTGSAVFRNISALGGTLGALNVVDTLTVGASGAQGVIQSYNYSPGAGTGWYIDSNGDATFNNITARGAIKTAVFEYAEVQAVGGIFLFRPSSTIKEATENSGDLILKVEKANLFAVNDWCKISNYTTTGAEPDASAAINNNGLTHVYKVSAVSNDGKTVTLANAASILTITSLKELEGGALVNMGKENGSSNYGIGINSSDNIVNLPRRAITLFETIIDPSGSPKVTYDYQDILGTLPPLGGNKVSGIYSTYMQDTQGLYTDNIYLGDANEYIAFYKAGNSKKLDIVTKQLVVGSAGYLQSGNFTRGDDVKFASAGTKIDLTNGEIFTPYFRLSQGSSGNLTSGVYVHGTIEATGGTIGSNSTNYWEIGDTTDYNNQASAKIIGHGSSYIQLGDSNTWRLATNRIHTGWYIPSDSLIHYPIISSKYWDFGVHAPTAGSDKFVYIRSSKAETTDTGVLERLLYDIDDTYSISQWDYKFWVDGAGNIHAQNFYIGNSPTPIGGGTGTVAERLLSGAGSSTQPVYFPTSGDDAGKPVAIEYTIQSSVPSNAVFTDTTYSFATGTSDGKIKITPSNSSTYEISVYGLKSAAFTESSAYATAAQGTKADNAISSSEKGAANGVATLDSDSKIPTSQLPSYVDDVLEYATESAFPSTGESGKIYVAQDTNKTYRWSGTNYVEISPSLALGETSATAYRGDRGAAAYAHAVTNKGSAFSSGLYKITTNSEGHVTAAVAVVKSDITALGIPGSDTTYVFDGTYNASTNKAATVATVTSAINALDVTAITGASNKTITSISETDGKISATYSSIAISTSQITDFPTLGAAASKGVTDNSSQTLVTNADTNLITGRTLYYHLAKAGYTTNTGTVTSVNTGVGLTGGAVTSSGTIKAKLRSETALINDSVAATETVGRIYPIVVDKSGYLAVNVPWTNVNSDYLTGITSSDVTTALGFTPYDSANPSGFTSNTGTVTSVTLTQGTGITVSSSGTAITTSGTRTISLADNYGDTKNPYASKIQNYVLAAPSNANGAPSFRALVAADIPSITKSKISDFPTNVSSFTNDAGYTTNTGTVTSVRVQASSPLQSSTSTAQTASLNTTISFIKQNPNLVMAGPSSGTSSAAPAFRALVAADIPSITKSKISDFPTTWAYSAITGAPTSLPNPNALLLNVYSGNSAPLSVSYDGSIASQSVNIAGIEAIVGITASAPSGGGAAVFELTKADGATSSFSVNMSGAVVTGAVTLTDSNGNPINEGSSSQPVYFSGGTPTSIGYTILTSVPANAKFTDTTYTFDGTYNASTNKAATVATVTSAINALDVAAISGTTAQTITSISETDGKISATYSNIAITKSQVTDFPSSMTPSSHTHGNITNAGDITATATIASGDRIVINDESASKITNSSITFGNDETKFLTNKGTWSTPGGTYTLPPADVGVLGGIQLGYSESGTNYAVKVLDEKAYVTVPWTDTTYSAGTGLSLSGTTFNHSNSVTAGTAGTSSNTSSTNGTLAVPYVTYDAQGHVTGSGTHTHTLTSYPEAFLSWGGKNFSGSYGPIDAAMISSLGANRLELAKPAGILVEYSRDNGTTWTDYGASDEAKQKLMSSIGNSFYIGKYTSSDMGNVTTDWKLRVTLISPACGVYSTLNKFAFYVSTTGASGCTVTIDAQTKANEGTSTWVTFANGVSVSGWSGWNIVNTSGITTYSNSTSQYSRIRFTFAIGNAASTTYSNALSVSKILGYGGAGWSTPNNLAANGHIYTYDVNLNATFPGNIYPSTNNSKTLGTSSLKWADVYATTLHGNLSWSEITSKPTATGSKVTGISIADHATGTIRGVKTTTTTASKVTVGTHSTDYAITAKGSGSFTSGAFTGGSFTQGTFSQGTLPSLTFTPAVVSGSIYKLQISFGQGALPTHAADSFTPATHGADIHVHTAPTLGNKVITVSASDVTVPIMADSNSTFVTGTTHTITDNGHTHSIT